MYFNKSTRREQDNWALDRYQKLDKRVDAIDEEYGDLESPEPSPGR